MLCTGIRVCTPVSRAQTRSATPTMPYPIPPPRARRPRRGLASRRSPRGGSHPRGVSRAPPPRRSRSTAEDVTARHRWLRAALDPEVATGLALSRRAARDDRRRHDHRRARAARPPERHAAPRSTRARRTGATTTRRELSTRLLQLVTDLGELARRSSLIADRRHGLRAVAQAELVPDPVRAGRDASAITLVTTAIKELVDRARPTLNPIAATLGPSFPSGHSSTAAACYAALALILSRGRLATGARAARSAEPSASRWRSPRAACCSTSTGSPT